MLTFNTGCKDCKYYSGGDCSHPYQIYCEYCSLWAPKERTVVLDDMDFGGTQPQREDV